MSEPGALQALRRYTRMTLATSPIVAVVPLLLSLANGVSGPRLAVLVVAVAVVLPLHWRRLGRAINAPAEVPPWQPPAVTLVLTVAVLCYVYTYADPHNALWAVLPGLAITELQFGMSLRQAWRRTAVLSVGIGALVMLLDVVVPGQGEGRFAILVIAVVGTMMAVPFAELVALRQWRIAIELDQARRDAAELGATRERLRFAEDLHDILGHALEVVSLKSELATRLATVDPARAHAEMAEVQRLARDALKDVRELVRGRRRTDLDTELAGARALLSSAGIDCVVDAEPAAEAHSELLGRVLREAVTNLLRHADTRRCWITVRPQELSVVNDGVSADAGDAAQDGGTGLAALARRVAAAGGTFSAGPGERAGTFTVSAVFG